MIIQAQELSQQALDNLITDYCLRDWGLNETEAPLHTRKLQVENALKQGSLVILFSEHEQSAHITSAADLMMD